MPVSASEIPKLETCLFPPYTMQMVSRRENPLIHATSTYYLGQEDRYGIGLNAHALRLLADFKTLKNNWDEDGALAPDLKTISQAEHLVKRLEKTGQPVFHVAPGASGEIMVDLRENGNSVEILFYPTQSKFVKFPVTGKPEQGFYADDLLPKILEWLHG